MHSEIIITSPDNFKTVPWKNGLGETIEMAINEGGTLDDFDWRLSMASVVEDGVFSNFEGYTRNLILISGDGINLQHNNSQIDKLSNLLDMATFDGGNKTVGNLHSGDITDFNIITRTALIDVQVVAELRLTNYILKASDKCFIYSLSQDAEITMFESNQIISLPAQHLLSLSAVSSRTAMITGTQLIVIYITDY